MDKLDTYFGKAKELAGDAGDKAKNIAGDVVSGAREKVQEAMKNAKAGKEIRQGITELEALPEIEGSILYKMELEAVIRSLSSLYLIINDERLDDDSVVEEVKKVIGKVQPDADQQAGSEEAEDEQTAIANVKAIAFNACIKALDALTAAGA